MADREGLVCLCVGVTMDEKEALRYLREKWRESDDVNSRPYIIAFDALEKAIPQRVGFSGWKGYRDTRFKCPSCKKTVRNDETYCHKCGQRLLFPKISFTPYVEGEKQETIITWDDGGVEEET